MLIYEYIIRIKNITLEVCVSGLGDYKFEASDLDTELILDINRYKNYIRVFLLDSQIGYISKRDTPNVLSTIPHMNKQIRVKEWKFISKAKHYLILQLQLCSYDTYKYYIYELSFKGTNETYIGSTVSLPQRINNHKNALKNNKHINHLLQKAYDKYKSGFTVKILFSSETKQKGIKLQKEQEYILQYQPSLNLINSYIPSGKVICDCGKEICYKSLSKHKKTKYHINKVIHNVISKVIDNVINNNDKVV